MLVLLLFPSLTLSLPLWSTNYTAYNSVKLLIAYVWMSFLIHISMKLVFVRCVWFSFIHSTINLRSLHSLDKMVMFCGSICGKRSISKLIKTQVNGIARILTTLLTLVTQTLCIQIVCFRTSNTYVCNKWWTRNKQKKPLNIEADTDWKDSIR